MKIIGHRGASKYCPENTIVGFEKALAQDVDGLEVDVRITKDGQLVISHDASINRATKKKGYIYKKTLEELKRIDFGEKFSKKFKGETIPTLNEVLALIKNKKTTLHLEIKNDPIIPVGLEEIILKTVQDAGLESQVVYSSFDHQALDRIHQLNNQAKIGLLFHINLVNPFEYIDRLTFPIHTLHPNHIYVTEDYIKAAHQRQMEVNVYTVNQRTWARKYEKMGVDGLITNDPLIYK